MNGNSSADNTGLTAPSSSVSVLKDFEKHGISMSHVTVDESKLLDQGYEKLPDSVIVSLNELLQYVPGVVAEQATRSAADENTSQMLKDAFRCYMKEGMRLSNSLETPGRYRGTLSKDGIPGYSGAAEFEPIEHIELSRTPQLVLHAFDLLSAVTGQYYMANINRRLSTIEESVQKVIDFLKDDKESKIQADQKILSDIASRITSIKTNSVDLQAELSQVNQIKRDALNNINFYTKQLKNMWSPSSSKKSAKQVKVNDLVSGITNSIPQYWCCVELYAKSSLLYVLLAGKSNPDDIDTIWNDLSDLKVNYKETYDLYLSWLSLKLRTKDAKERLAVMPFSLLGTVVSILPGGELVKLVTDIPSDIQESVKQKRENCIAEKLQLCLSGCADLSPVDSIMDSIEKYKLIQNNGFEILKTPDAAYIKFFKETDTSSISNNNTQRDKDVTEIAEYNKS